ncbi:MAG TPA: UDP-N-acetylglucosamine--N-acetylmuramyl-(pentapeptide) pyrophosphoryl-undecaprenol N-acetylglucosamine transferase [Gaiellaceae bacterium]|nr:UDP-N-acetylglucosamine--N-acetylmuramyl-(pentapeptide) pyrophosphoryl-undecaprenol N-acetylglucosamine transferase [Gaiellaceae bacterium]
MAEALRARGVDVTFAGSPDRVEARLVPERGYAFDAFRVAGFPRRPGLGLVRALVLALRAPLACLRILRRRRPDVVLGGGGYVAGPMVLAAWLRRIPAALTEADAHVGLANRLAAPFAKRIFLAYPAERASGKTRVVGRPIPAASRAQPRAAARAALGLDGEGPTVAVFGGSIGALTLNELAVDAWGAEGPSVLHVTGERDYEDVRRRVTRPGYHVAPFVEDFGAVLGAADLVVARSGGSVWEVAAAGRPAILVPYPDATGDHQSANARYFERAGGALVVPDDEAHARVPALVAELLAAPERLEALGAAMKDAAKPDAAERIADELIALATARR